MKVAEIIPEHTASKVLIAFDHMRLKLKDFEWAYKYVYLFQEVLTNEKEKDEAKKEKEEQKKEDIIPNKGNKRAKKDD